MSENQTEFYGEKTNGRWLWYSQIKKKKKGQGRIVVRRKYDACINIRQYDKQDLPYMKEGQPSNIPYTKILPLTERRMFHNLDSKDCYFYNRFFFAATLFEFMMEKIYLDMVENKNTYIVRKGLELVICTRETKTLKHESFFSFNTQDNRLKRVDACENAGYAWNLIPSAEAVKLLTYYNDVKGERYILCKTSLGKQSSQGCSRKRNSLIFNLKKKGLSLSSIQEHLNSLLLSGLSGKKSK